MYSICYVTLQDHVIKRSSDFIEGNSSLYLITLASLVATGSGDIIFLNLLRDLTSPSLYGGKLLILSYRIVNFGSDSGLVVVEILCHHRAELCGHSHC